MAPVHDTDLAEERWARAEWARYELWEKTEQRARKQRKLWIAGACLVFLVLSAFPIVIENRPKWIAQKMIRKLAHEIEILKRDSALLHGIYRIQFEGGGSLRYHIEKVKTCTGPVTSILREGSLAESTEQESRFVLMNAQQAASLGIDSIVESFCYDSIRGAKYDVRTLGFGVAIANDLTQSRLDRMSILLIETPIARISLD